MHANYEEGVNMYAQNFTFAFGVRDYLKNEYKDDPNYVNWEVHAIKGDGGSSEVEHKIGTHKCTEEEWKRFY